MFFLTFSTLIILISRLKLVHLVNCGIHQPTILGQLRQTLLCHYDISERPNQVLDKPITISLQLQVKSFDFDELGIWSTRRPQLTLSCWMPMTWTDEHLKWNPVEWEQIDKVLVGSKEIWMPDVTLHNSDHGKSILSHTEVHCEVDSHGEVWCVLPVTFEVLCRADYKKWPYGFQNCWFFFGSWMSTHDYIDYNNETFDITFDEVQENQRWEIVQAKSRVAIKKFNGKDYPTLSANLRLKRLPSHYEMCFQPTALLMTISNLIVFFINPDQHHRQRFSIIFLAMLVHYLVLSYFSWYMPNVGDVVPDILLFFRDSMIVTMLALLETILIRGIFEQQVTVPVALGNFVQNIHASPSGNIIFIEFLPGSGIEEKNLTLEEAITTSAKKRPVTIQTLLVQLIDRVVFGIVLVMYFVYFVIIALDWM